MLGLFGNIKALGTSIVVAVISIAITSLLFIAYDSFIDDPDIKETERVTCKLEKEKMVSTAQYEAQKAIAARLERERDALVLSLENSKKLADEALRAKEEASRLAEEKIKKDLSEEGPRVTKEDMEWLNR